MANITPDDKILAEKLVGEFEYGPSGSYSDWKSRRGSGLTISDWTLKVQQVAQTIADHREKTLSKYHGTLKTR